MSNEIDDDEPLDPKVEAVRRRLAKMQMVSSGIMIIGLMAVAVALVYRLSGDDKPAAVDSAAVPLPAESAIALPAGAQIEHTAMDGNRIMLTVREPGGARAILIYAANGGLLSRIELR